MAFEHRKPGDRWTPKAFELNAILDAGAAQAAAAGVAGRTNGAGFIVQPGLVRVKNLTGANRDRYTAWKLADSRWVLDGNSNLADCIFSIGVYSAGEAVAILQTPLKADEIGYATIAGPTIAKVTGDGTTSDRNATPNGTGVLAPDSDGPVRLLQERPGGGGYILVNIVPCP